MKLWTFWLHNDGLCVPINRNDSGSMGAAQRSLYKMYNYSPNQIYWFRWIIYQMMVINSWRKHYFICAYSCDDNLYVNSRASNWMFYNLYLIILLCFIQINFFFLFLLNRKSNLQVRNVLIKFNVWLFEISSSDLLIRSFAVLAFLNTQVFR